MAGASEITVAAPARRRALRAAPGPVAVYGLLAAGVALLTWLVWSQAASDQYDNFFALAWGREIAHGALPSESVPFAATPHPLTMLVGAALSLLGDAHGFGAIQVVNTLAWGAVVAGAVLVAAAAFGTAAAVVTTALLISNPALVQAVDNALSDGLFAALVLTALAVELHRPRRGTAVLVLLSLAGLARPEAWLLAAGYWIYVARGLGGRERLRLAALALAAPVIWALLDAAATGDPLFSLTTTRDNTVLADRATGLGSVIPQLRESLGGLLDIPELAGAAVGLAVIAARRRRAAALPVAVAVLGLVGFAALGVARLPMNPRYLLVPCVLLAVIAAHGLVEVWQAAAARGRLAMSLAACVALGGGALVVAQRQRGLDDRLDNGRQEWTVRSDLSSVSHAPAVRRALGTCRARSASYRTVSQVAFVTGSDLTATAVTADRVGGGLYFVPGDATARRLFPVAPALLAMLQDGRAVASSAHWRAVALGC